MIRCNTDGEFALSKPDTFDSLNNILCLIDTIFKRTNSSNSDRKVLTWNV